MKIQTDIAPLVPALCSQEKAFALLLSRVSNIPSLKYIALSSAQTSQELNQLLTVLQAQSMGLWFEGTALIHCMATMSDCGEEAEEAFFRNVITDRATELLVYHASLKQTVHTLRRMQYLSSLLQIHEVPAQLKKVQGQSEARAKLSLQRLQRMRPELSWEESLAAIGLTFHDLLS